MVWFEKRETLTAYDVFTPARIPLDDKQTYVNREDAEGKLEECFQSGLIPVVYGEYGVGKTTLVRRYFRNYPAESNVFLTISAATTLPQVFQSVLEHIGYRVEVETTTKDIRNNSFGASAVVRGEIGETYGTEKTERIAVGSPTDAGLLKIMQKNEILLILDEVHKATSEFKTELSHFIKAARSDSSRFPLLVLTGTTMSPDELTSHDQGIGRYLKPVQVNPMTVGESRDLLQQGFGKLSMEHSQDLEERIVKIAAGAPSLLQEICLKMALAASKATRNEVLPEDFEDAVRAYLREHEQSLTKQYIVSIEHSGPKRYRKQVLAAMSLIPKDYVSLEDIRLQVTAQLGEFVPSTTLSGPLQKLKAGSSSILVDFEDEVVQASQILTMFRDPMMKSFIRFIRAAETENLLPDAADI